MEKLTNQELAELVLSLRAVQSLGGMKDVRVNVRRSLIVQACNALNDRGVNSNDFTELEALAEGRI